MFDEKLQFVLREPNTLPSVASHEQRAKSVAPSPDGFVTNVDSALQEQIFDVAQ